MSQTDGTQSQGQGGEPDVGPPTNPDSEAQKDVALVQQSPRPNVCLARGRKPITVNGPINMGVITVNVGSEEEQRHGFYTEHAEHLIQQFAGVYKRALGVGQSMHADDVDAAFAQAEAQGQNGGVTDGDQT